MGKGSGLKNRVRRYRLKDHTALQLGLIINKSKRYRLDKEKENELIAIRNSKVKRLFFDIETSPNVVYAWRIGWKINLDPSTIIEERKIICLSYKWEDDDIIYSLTWDKNQCDKQMLIDFIKVAEGAHEVIGHNSDRFDMKWLRTRAIFHRVPMMATFKTLDTLKKARSGFNFNSNRLDYIAQYLKVGAKVKHSGFDMWKGVMAGDKESMKEMVHYCEGDIIVLEDVYAVMKDYVTTNTHAGVIASKHKASCPVCASEKVSLFKNTVTARGTVSRLMECDCCNYKYTVSNTVYRSYLLDNPLII